MEFLSGFFFLIGILSIVFVTSWSAPLVYPNDEEEFGTRVDDGFLVDDMIVSLTRNGAINPSAKWPGGIVYYKISSVFDADFVAIIMTAMREIESVSCVRFVEANFLTYSYVNIVSEGTGCSARVGRSGGVQKLNLNINATHCRSVPNVIHELIHSCGFYHEHMSPYRDSYVTIIWENITPGKEFNFEKLSNETVTDFGYGYDLSSLMHYGRKAFTVNNLPTIVPHNSSAVIGQRIGLSPLDIDKLNAMYNCPM
ncbi:zinc metalloproteinase nas-15-like [Haematobia irritans]|uniref:zinc metalloproteinase nas-15-like n=1 Tax=Haematobia irritans TaxID=7368 RepID=UPI003F4F61D7